MKKHFTAFYLLPRLLPLSAGGRTTSADNNAEQTTPAERAE